MKSLASFVVLAVVAAPAWAQGASYPAPTGQVAPDEPQGAGPRGSSERAAGEVRFDEVGYATIGGGSATASASVTGLAPGSFAEVTAVATGRTILIAVTGEGVAPGRLATLSQAAAAQLAAPGDPIAIRVRRVAPTGPDVASLRSGVVVDRGEAPPGSPRSPSSQAGTSVRRTRTRRHGSSP